MSDLTADRSWQRADAAERRYASLMRLLPEDFFPEGFWPLVDELEAIEAAVRAEWADHRERCHGYDPDGTIAFLHQRADEQAATIEALRAAVPVESSRPCGMGCPDIGHCYSCGMESEAGHDPGCEWLAARSRRGVL